MKFQRIRKFNDLSGQKFELLTVLNRVSGFYRNGDKKVRYNCKCDCGNFIEKDAADLKRGRSKSCGCLNKSTTELRTLRYYRRYECDAKKRGYTFSLSLSDFTNLVNRKCYYCNTMETRKIYKYSDQLNGIDRKNNSIGYELENCVPCCSVCNRMKMDLDHDIFINKIKEIYGNRSKENH